MGRDKMSLRIGGKTLVERVAAVLRDRCDEVIVCGGEQSPPGVRAVRDDRPGLGPLAGMESGLAAARFPLVFVAAGDMPFLRAELVDRLVAILRDRAVLAVVPHDGKRVHPLCAAYSRGVLPRLRADLDGGLRAAREFVRNLDDTVYVSAEELASLGDTDRLLMNINSPEDLRRARDLAGA